MGNHYCIKNQFIRKKTASIATLQFTFFGNHMRRKIGVNFLDQYKASVDVWAPFCKSVSVEILHPDKKDEIYLNKDNFGYWHGEANISDGTLYQFKLDNEKVRPDPVSLSQPQGVHGPSEARDVNKFQWTDQSWKNLALGKYIIYELHVGTFTTEGTFEAIIPKLSYLKDLGINAIELMPIAQFPGNRNWGYDGVYPFAVQQSYGGISGLQKLVNACHLEGIAVILDVVYNHMGPEGNYLSEYGPYFTDKYQTPWGKALNFDDAWCDHVRNFFIQNALMWFRDFHIDGLRLDAVHAIKDLSAKHFLKELTEETERLSEILGVRKYLIAECDLNDAKYIQPHPVGGFGLHAQWVDEFHHAIHALITGEKMGYYADFGSLEHLRKGFSDTFIYNGTFSAHRKKVFGNDASGNPFNQFVVFSQNHDQIGNRMLGERLSTLVSFEAQKLAAGTIFLSPYIPLLFMGEEYGETNPFLYFVSHTDENLVEAVRNGRKNEFKDFHNSEETPDPQSEKTFDKSKLSWKTEDEKSATLLRYYKKWITIRQENEIFENFDRRKLNAWITDKQILVVHQKSENQELLGLFNLQTNNQQEQIKLTEEGIWQKIIDSADVIWIGPGTSMPGTFNKKLNVNLTAQSIVVYKKNK